MATYESAQTLLETAISAILTGDAKTNALQTLANAKTPTERHVALHDVFMAVTNAAGHANAAADIIWPSMPDSGTDEQLIAAVNARASMVESWQRLLRKKPASARPPKAEPEKPPRHDDPPKKEDEKDRDTVTEDDVDDDLNDADDEGTRSRQRRQGTGRGDRKRERRGKGTTGEGGSGEEEQAGTDKDKGKGKGKAEEPPKPLPASPALQLQLKKVVSELQRDFPENLYAQQLTPPFLQTLKSKTDVEGVLAEARLELENERTAARQTPNGGASRSSHTSQQSSNSTSSDWGAWLTFKNGLLGCGCLMTGLLALVILLVGGTVAINWARHYTSAPAVETQEESIEESMESTSESEGDINDKLLEQLNSLR